jgi:uncharacterized phage protein (TIGR01671 family)
MKKMSKEKEEMREIKFRGQRVNTKEWVYGYYLKLHTFAKNEIHYIVPFNTELVSIYHKRHFHWDDLVEVNPKTVGQYTGLLDKQGKEIYEKVMNLCSANY